VELLREGGPLPPLSGPVKRTTAARLGGLVEVGMNDSLTTGTLRAIGRPRIDGDRRGRLGKMKW
jgi:hypothetical protein